MPIYEYVCRICGAKTEAFQRMDAGPEGLICKACGATELKKVLSAPSIVPTSGKNAGNCSTGCCGGNCGL